MRTRIFAPGPVFTMVIFLVNLDLVIAGPADATYHNRIRQAVNEGTGFNGYDYSHQQRPATPIANMVYNAALEASSLAVAGTCDFNHSMTPNGENLYASTGPGTVEAAVNSWASEVTDYNNDTGCAPGKVCGHYTQIVWANSLSVGCAATMCNPLTDNGTPVFGDVASTYIVCQYSPAGNFNGQRPYLSSAAPAAPPTPTNTSAVPAMLFMLDKP